MKRRPNIERQLAHWIFIVGAIATPNIFLHILDRTLHFQVFFPGFWDWLNPSRWANFVREMGCAGWLAAAVFYLFLVSTSAARTDFVTLKGLFSLSRVPREWSDLNLARLVPVTIISFIAVFGTLFWFVGNILYFTCALLFWNALDHAILYLQRINLAKFLDDPVYFPSPNDEHLQFIERRRTLARAFLLGNPHRLRLSLFTAAILAALIFALHVVDLPGWDSRQTAYGVVLLTIISNEALMAWWRHRRNQDLDNISDDQSGQDRKAAEQRKTDQPKL